MIADREKEIRAFISEEYWKIAANVSPTGTNAASDQFEAPERLGRREVRGEERGDAHAVRDTLPRPVRGLQVEQTEKLDKADAPFKTSTLQQQAAIRLRFSGKRTMKVAQELYEGIDVDGSGPVGFITYMRTDSLRVSEEAMTAVREKIDRDFGERYLPRSRTGTPPVRLPRRPTRPSVPPIWPLPGHDQGLADHDQFKLYQLIYARFVASQMTPAVFMVTDVAITAAPGFSRPRARF